MRYAFWPGCVSRGACRELYRSMAAVAPRLDLDLVELTEATCTGAGVLNERDPELVDLLNARIMAMAERLELPLLNICSTCQGVLSGVQDRLRRHPGLYVRVNELLAEESLQYRGAVPVKNFLWVLVEDVGLDWLRSLVTRPLRGLRVAPFYGCYILRPSSVLGINERPERARYLEQVIDAVGAEPVEFSGKSKCCGFPILTTNKTTSLSMAGDHLLEAKGEGADCMVTPCPLCHLNLDSQQPEAAKVKRRAIDLPILHLPQMIGLAMGLSPGALGLDRHIVHAGRVVDKVAVKA